MRVEQLLCFFPFLFVSCRNQITVIGKERTVEAASVPVIRTDLQAKPAFQALGRGILVLMLFVRLLRVLFLRLLISPDTEIRFFQILMNRRAVRNEIMNDGELLQRTDDDFLSLQIPDKGFAGQRRTIVDHHGAAAADALQAGAFPADAGGLPPASRQSPVTACTPPRKLPPRRVSSI